MGLVQHIYAPGALEEKKKEESEHHEIIFW